MGDRASYVIDKDSGTVRIAVDGAVSFLPVDEYKKLDAYLRHHWPDRWVPKILEGSDSAVDVAIQLIKDLAAKAVVNGNGSG